MPVVPPALVAHALADLLGQTLVRDVPVTVPGLGTFTRHHRPGHVDTSAVRPTMRAPRDEVAFHPGRP